MVVDSPAEALHELDTLVRRMLVERGYPLGEGELERTAEERIEPGVLAGYRPAREITLQVDRGAEVDPAEIGKRSGFTASSTTTC